MINNEFSKDLTDEKEEWDTRGKSKRRSVKKSSEVLCDKV